MSIGLAWLTWAEGGRPRLQGKEEGRERVDEKNRPQKAEGSWREWEEGAGRTRKQREVEEDEKGKGEERKKGNEKEGWGRAWGWGREGKFQGLWIPGQVFILFLFSWMMIRASSIWELLKRTPVPLIWIPSSPPLSTPSSEVKVAQSCLTLCNPMDCSPPGSSVHGLLQARILEWVDIHFSRRSSQPRDQTWVSHIAGKFYTIWATTPVQHPW